MSDKKNTEGELRNYARRIKKEMQEHPTKHEIHLPAQIADGRNALLYYAELGLNPQLKGGVFEGRCLPDDKQWVTGFSAPSGRWVLRYGRTVIGGFRDHLCKFTPN